MEEEFRAQWSEAGYTHEILAEFGEQETGVFDKDKLDEAMTFCTYAYDKLTLSQRRNVENNNIIVDDYTVPKDFHGIYRQNYLRTMGIDWDKRKCDILSKIKIISKKLTQKKKLIGLVS